VPRARPARSDDPLPARPPELPRADHRDHHARIATSIIVEATLSFLGLGTQPPTPSWGWDLKANVAFIQANAWLSLFPGLAIFLTVLGFNLFGDGLRDALDPRLK